MYLSTHEPLLLPQWCSDVEDEDVILHRRLTDGRLLCVMPRLTGFSLALGMPYPFHRIGIFEESWDYTNELAAWDAFHGWNGREPEGWTRHPASGRHRIRGNPELEYIQGYGLLQEQVIHAVLHTIGRTEHMVYTEEIRLDFPTVFPLGTQCFVSYTEPEDCPHVPVCQRPYTTFYYQDRSVVIPMNEMTRFNPEQIIQRLTGEV